VQFLGAIQFWVRLTSPVAKLYSQALLATLDPVTGQETFVSRPPLQVTPFRVGLVDFLLPVKKLNAAAVTRGASVAEMLRVREVRVDGVALPLPRKQYRTVSWTGNVPKNST
jgi:hypothetical protein